MSLMSDLLAPFLLGCVLLFAPAVTAIVATSVRSVRHPRATPAVVLRFSAVCTLLTIAIEIASWILLDYLAGYGVVVLAGSVLGAALVPVSVIINEDTLNEEANSQHTT